MTLKGETFASGHQPEDGEIVSELKVLKSGGGYYLGTEYFDKDFEGWFPYSRESVEYYATREEAEKALEEGTWSPRV